VGDRGKAAVRPRVLALVGPRGAGKTTLGIAVAARLQWPFRDADHLLAARVGEAAGDHLARVGEPRFREIEEAVCLEALEGVGVLALGGGAVLSASVRRSLRAPDVFTVYVHADVEALVERIRSSTEHRPALTGEPLEAEVRTLLRRRESLYERVADVRVETFPANVDSCCGTILARMPVAP